MVVRLGPRCRTSLQSAVAGSDVRLHPDDRLEPGFLRLFLELPRAVKVTVIGYRKRRLLELQRSGYEIIYTVCAVEKGIFGVTVKMNEGHLVR